PAGNTNDRLLALVEEAEAHCVRDSRLVYACCDEDAAGLTQEYGGAPGTMVVIPNGTDTEQIRYASAAERVRVRRHVGMSQRPVVLFLASGHRPNLEAAEHLFAIAERMHDVDFAFVGNIKGAFEGRTLP